jgi:hypothetical protein
MRTFILGVLVGMVLMLALIPTPVEAQAIARLFAATSTGAPIALRADASGNLKVVGQ